METIGPGSTLFSDETATNMKSHALAGYRVHVALLNFRNEYNKRLIKIGNCLVAFHQVETENIEGLWKVDIEGVESQYIVITCHRYSLLRKTIQVTSVMKGRGKHA